MPKKAVKKPAAKPPAPLLRSPLAAPAARPIDIVGLVSDALHEVNLTLAGLLPSEPGYNELEQKRDELEARLKRLVREFIHDNTDRFIAADHKLVEVNDALRQTLQSLQAMKDAIDAVAQLIGALDKFIVAVFPPV